MKGYLEVFVCLAAALTPTALAQTTDQGERANAGSPAVFIYVSNVVNPDAVSSTYEVTGYSGDSDGRLTPIPGSPFPGNVSQMEVSGNYLFGLEWDNSTMDTYSIAPNGALKKIETINTAKYDPQGCGVYIGVFSIDRSGEDLYNLVGDPDCVGTHFQYYKIEKSSGKLDYFGETSELKGNIGQLAILKDNERAYSPYAFSSGENIYGSLIGLDRHGDGDLSEFNLGTLGPRPQRSGDHYFPMKIATDETNHLAVTLQEENADGAPISSMVLATYTVKSNGDLTTTSTNHNMPSAPTGDNGMSMSPSGKLLALGGAGLEIFHFNGASPITKFKKLLPEENISQLFWDNNDHLYVIGAHSPNVGQLYVFKITPTSLVEVTGSPYTLPPPVFMVVQPR